MARQRRSDPRRTRPRAAPAHRRRRRERRSPSSTPQRSRCADEVVGATTRAYDPLAATVASVRSDRRTRSGAVSGSTSTWYEPASSGRRAEHTPGPRTPRREQSPDGWWSGDGGLDLAQLVRGEAAGCLGGDALDEFGAVLDAEHTVVAPARRRLLSGQRISPVSRAFLMGGTGLEPVTPSLSN